MCKKKPWCKCASAMTREGTWLTHSTYMFYILELWNDESTWHWSNSRTKVPKPTPAVNIDMLSKWCGNDHGLYNSYALGQVSWFHCNLIYNGQRGGGAINPKPIWKGGGLHVHEWSKQHGFMMVIVQHNVLQCLVLYKPHGVWPYNCGNSTYDSDRWIK